MKALLAVLAVLAQATFSSRVDMVRVDVLVTDNGKPVLGLTPADFEILDNGVAQQVELVSFDQVPLNVVLVFDMSDSVEGERRDKLFEGAGALLGGLKPDDQSALVTFSHVVDRGAKLTKDVAAVRAALERAEAIGETALVDGAFAGMLVGESDVGRGLLDRVQRRRRHVELAAACLGSRYRQAVGRRGLRRVGAVTRSPGVPGGADVAHRRPPLRSRADPESRVGLPRRARGVPPPLSRELHTARCYARGMASARRARQGTPDDGQGEAGISRS